MNRTLSLLALTFFLVCSARAASKKDSGPVTFAPVPPDHELASVWNDPDFQRRLIGTYGFLSDVEPRMKPEEMEVYTKEIKPMLEKDPAKAISLLTYLAKQKDASAQFDFYLGTAYFQQSDLTNAVRNFEAAIEKNRDFRRAQKNLAFALVRSERYEEAIAPLLRTITLGGGDGKVFGLLGIAYLKQNQFASATGAFQQATMFEPENLTFKEGAVKCAVAMRQYDYALAMVEEMLAQNPDKETLWMQQANIYIQKQENDRAAISLEMLRRLGKANPPNLFLLGDLYMAAETRDLALAAYLQAVELDAGKDLAKALRPAQILVNRGAYAEAGKLFEKIRAGAANLNDADQLKLLKLESKVAMGLGQGDQAIQTLEQISQKNPLDGEALLLAGDYYARTEQPEKAVFRYETAAKLEGFEADAWVKHAQLLVVNRKYTEAAELLRKAQKVKPRDNVQRYLEKIEQLALSVRS